MLSEKSKSPDRKLSILNRGIGVGVAQALVEGAEQVEVLIAVLVVGEHALLRGLRDLDDVDPVPRRRGEARRRLEHGQRPASIATREEGEARARRVGDVQPQVPEATRLVGERAVDEGRERDVVERLELHDAAARAAPH